MLLSGIHAMQQAPAGAVAVEPKEVTVMVVWPSVARYTLGKFLGQLLAIQIGFYIFTLSNLIALAAIPAGLVLYFWRAGTGLCYRLTNRRVMEMRFGGVSKSISLDDFDSIRVEQGRSQVWFQAGDLVFLNGDKEVFRLESVCHPESFRHTCLKSRVARTSVKQVLDREAATA
jgi:hypothetical protein